MVLFTFYLAEISQNITQQEKKTFFTLYIKYNFSRRNFIMPLKLGNTILNIDDFKTCIGADIATGPQIALIIAPAWQR